MHKLVPALFLLLSVGLAACGGGPSASSSGASAARNPSTSSSGAAAVLPDEVVVKGQITAPGTKGPVLLFAFAGNSTAVDGGDVLTVATVDADGQFAFSVPPESGLTIAFLADGSNDGAIDGGDPVAVLSSPAFADLQGGDTVVISDIALDFTARKANAGSIDARRAGAPAAHTPTPIPAQ